MLVQEDRPLAYLSKELGVKNFEWSVYIKELMAIVEEIHVWWPYLLGRKFFIVMDQQPLNIYLSSVLLCPNNKFFFCQVNGV